MAMASIAPILLFHLHLHNKVEDKSTAYQFGVEAGLAYLVKVYWRTFVAEVYPTDL